MGVAVPEKYDGLGQTALEIGVVFEEMGRALYGGPYLACVGLAIPTLLHAGDDDACMSLLPADRRRRVRGDRRDSRGQRQLGRALDGHRSHLLRRRMAAHRCEKLRLGRGRRRSAIGDRATRGRGEPVRRARGRARRDGNPDNEALDLARPIAALSLQRISGHPGRHDPVRRRRSLTRSLDEALALLAAEQAGGAQACLEMCVDYAKTREQFGRVIGSFQAVAHTCVDMLQRVEFARSIGAVRRSPPASSRTATSRSQRGWQRRTAGRRSARWPWRRFTCTAASASPGSTTRTCTTVARSPVSISSAAPTTTIWLSPTASACSGRTRTANSPRRGYRQPGSITPLI